MAPKKVKYRETENLVKNKVLWGLFFEKLLQNIDACVMVTDSFGQVIFINWRYQKFFDCRENDIMGGFWVDHIVPERNRDDVKDIFEEIKEKDTLGRFDSPVVSLKGEKKYFCWLDIPLKEHKESFYMFVGRQIKSQLRNPVRLYKDTPHKLNTAYREVVDALFQASMLSEPTTALHAERVMSFAVILAKALKLRKDRLEKLKVAALLHDIGKLAVNEKILYKKGKLTDKEFEQIKKHPQWAAEVISFVYFLHDIIPILASHHENYDGTGYPGGLKGAKIPLEARILSVVDVFEALTADRPYRNRFPLEKAIDIMESENGKKFDPKIMNVFMTLVRKGKVKDDSLPPPQ